MINLIFLFMKVFSIVYSISLVLMISSAIINKQKIKFGMMGNDCLLYSFYITSIILTW